MKFSLFCFYLYKSLKEYDWSNTNENYISWEVNKIKENLQDSKVCDNNNISTKSYEISNVNKLKMKLWKDSNVFTWTIEVEAHS